MPPETQSPPASAFTQPRRRGPFAVFMNKYGTPLTTVFFLISTVTGVALFFHWGPMAFHPMHEWLSMVLLLAFALHLIKNWTPLVNYGRRGLLSIPLVIGLASTAYFFMQPAANPAGNKQVAFKLAAMAGKASLLQLAPLCGTDAEGMMSRLHARNMVAETPDETVEQIAKSNSHSTNEVLLVLMQNKKTNAGHEHAHGGRGSP